MFKSNFFVVLCKYTLNLNTHYMHNSNMIIQIRPICNPMPTIFKNTEMNLGFCLL